MDAVEHACFVSEIAWKALNVDLRIDKDPIHKVQNQLNSHLLARRPRRGKANVHALDFHDIQIPTRHHIDGCRAARLVHNCRLIQRLAIAKTAALWYLDCKFAHLNIGIGCSSLVGNGIGFNDHVILVSPLVGITSRLDVAHVYQEVLPLEAHE